MTDLSTLLERVRAASGPSRELDMELCVSINKSLPLLNFTGSIDAAVALCERVLPGWAWSIDAAYGKPPEAMAHVCPYEPDSEGNKRVSFGYAATPALALVAAILSTLIAKGGTHD